MSGYESLLSVVLASVRGMPAGHVRTLASVLAAASGTPADIRGAVLGAVPNPAYRHQAAGLLEAWTACPDIPPVAVALALESALATRESERLAETVEVVATGPGSPHVSLRQTRAVLLQVVEAARQELILVTYAAYKIPELLTAVEETRSRGVLVRLILETMEDSAGTLTRDGIAAFESVRENVEVYCWPLERRPHGARLHAKAAMADSEIAFVTSANLTGYALDQNLEAGVLIRGGPAPARLMAHFRALIAKSVLHRV